MVDFLRVAKNMFAGGHKAAKFHFKHLKLSKTFFAKKLTEKC